MMSIIENAELPISTPKYKGKGVELIELRKEDNHRKVLTIEELRANFSSVKNRLSSDLRSILAS
jgi:hypothetical protein